MKKSILLAVVAFILAAANWASAALIYSTPNSTVEDAQNFPASYGVFGLGSSQWLATEFSLTSNYTISGVQGWIMESSSYATANNAAVSAVLYSDGGSVPGNRLFSTTFTPGDQLNWYGNSGLNWNVNAGTYWLAFEVDRSLPGSVYGYEYAMPTTRNDAVNNAGWNAGHPTLAYSPNGLLDIGVRVYSDDPATVPEPGSIVLVLMGGVGLMYCMRRRNRKN